MSILEEKKTNEYRNHSIILENREKLSVSGVGHVSSFNSETVILETVAGVLTIKGGELDVNKLNIEDGNISISGIVYSLNYSDKHGIGDRTGFLGKMFK
ncbi:MAG TPA: sporulation protein YabP [Oscillospiraceae bacterium]|nr:sporulation protein YabP [Oscillospiraceae bacterium]